jgi:hypothetical protein
MALREEIQRKIEKKQQEIRALEDQVRDCNIYINSLQDVLKMIPREAEEGKEIVLRHGSLLSQARDAIRKARKPLHVTELLEAIGKPNAKKNRLALSGSLAAYVRRGEIFTRPEPNTFGLVELEQQLEKDAMDLAIPAWTSVTVKA